MSEQYTVKAIDPSLMDLALSARAISSADAELRAQGQDVPPRQLLELESASQAITQIMQQLQAAINNKASDVQLQSLRAIAATTSQHASQIAGQAQSVAAALAAGKNSTSAGAEAALNTQARNVADRTHRALFDDKIFDPSLRFGSADEEEAYRQREAGRRALLDGLDANDPRHERNRLLIQRDQLRDAMAHGADRDPRAHDMHQEIDTMLRRQREAAIAAGADPQRFDAEDEKLRNRFPKGSQRFEEKGAYLGRGWDGDAKRTGTGDAVAEKTTASPLEPKEERQATQADTAISTVGAFEDEPTDTPTQRAAATLKLAGVRADAEASSPVAPKHIVSQVTALGRGGLT